MTSSKTIPSVRRKLLRWYREAKRDLPWRRTRDAYAIWLSEVMCQQTRVDTVIPYYEKFMARFPTMKALAAAHEDDVLGLWSGLGYYRRARLLHQGVREVVAKYNGKMPEDPVARLALPGIGRYTAGAIGSIVFGRAEPIVDGNVVRVLSRLFAVDDPNERRREERLWQLAEELVGAGKDPGDFNQSLMELGATICSKSNPACSACPVRGECEALRMNRVQALPIAKRRKAPEVVHYAAVVARKGQKVFLTRGEKSLFSGLYNLPMAHGDSVSAAREALRSAGLSTKGKLSRTGELEHVLSHRRMRVTVYEADNVSAAARSSAELVDQRTLSKKGISRLTTRVLTLHDTPIGNPLKAQPGARVNKTRRA